MSTAPPVADKRPDTAAPAPQGAQPAWHEQHADNASLKRSPAAAEPQPEARQAAEARLDRLAVRARLPMSQPGDAVEREADALADQVMRTPAGDGITPPAADMQETLARQARMDDDETMAAPTVPAEALSGLGAGQPLAAETRAWFEPRFGRDLGHVRIHDDAAADRAAQAASARAFAHGSDIVFASGEYQPDTSAGRHLLAHELAHVLQQDAGAVALMRTPNDEAASAEPADPAAAARVAAARRELERFVVPVSKRRHGAVYQQWLSSNALRHGPDYDRDANPPAQISQWEAQLAGYESNPTWTRHFSRINLSPDTSNPQRIRFGTALSEPRSFSDWVGYFKRPQWNHGGQWLRHRLEVDHIVELQAAGWPGNAAGDTVQNYELLDKSTNASAGGTIYSGLRSKMRALLAAEQGLRPEQIPLRPRPGSSGDDAETELKQRGVVFTSVEGGSVGDRRGGGARSDANSEYWVLAELQAGEHLAAIQAAPAAASPSGTAASFVLLSAGEGLEIGRFATRDGLAANVSGPASRRLASMRISALQLSDPDYGNAAPGTPIGTLAAVWQLPPGITPASETVSLPILKATGGQFNGYLQMPGTMTAEAESLSEIQFRELGVDAGGVNAIGTLRPSLPLLENQSLDVSWVHEDIRFGKTFSAEQLTLTVPGLSIDGASVTVFHDRNGFGAEGRIDFSLAHLGIGALTIGVDARRRFSAEGSLDIDSRHFDEANLNLWYREGAFGGRGRIAITQAGRIRGLNSARVEIEADARRIRASGEAQPAIPGVQQAGLSAEYSVDNGLVVGGTLQVAEIPGIRQGSVRAELRKREGEDGSGWRVRAEGQALPALPGIDSAISITYDDGAFDGRITANYRRSIFSGEVTVGLTNRPVNADGEIAGDQPPEGAGTLSIYGGGTVTARITDWLQGGVGIRLRPGGDILISGRIGIPAPVTVFDQYPPPARARRTLFSMPTVSIPLVGIAVGSTVVGLALTINGSVTGRAHVGPGRLTETELRIDDFNPAEPDSLHISGNAAFNLPAEAGVGAQLDAGLTLGAAIVSATAGLSASAEALVRADVSPRVDLDWRPATGLHLHAALDTSLTPKLAFSLNGYAEVTANALVTTFSLWRKDWNLARREIGSNLALGMHVPVDYYSDGRGVVFDPDRVNFRVPSLNADTFDQLLNHEPGGSERVERDERRA